MGVPVFPGKFAAFKLGLVNVRFTDWTLNDAGDEIDEDGFSETADVDGLIRHQKSIGMVNTTVSCKGRLNSSALALVAGLRTGTEITGLFLGLSATVGWTVSGVVQDNSYGQSQKDAANQDIKIHVNSVTALTGFGS